MDLPHQGPSLRELYPDASDAELEAIGETLDRYLAVVARIYERARAESEGAPPPAG